VQDLVQIDAADHVGAIFGEELEVSLGPVLHGRKIAVAERGRYTTLDFSLAIDGRRRRRCDQETPAT
jgi:hypothetical protein